MDTRSISSVFGVSTFIFRENGHDINVQLGHENLNGLVGLWLTIAVGQLFATLLELGIAAATGQCVDVPAIAIDLMLEK